MGRQWAKEHPDTIREINARYCENHPENRRASIKKYHQSHPEQAKLDNHRRRARLNQVVGEYTIEDIQLLFKSQKGRCWWCSKKLKKYEIDHRIPLSRGGSNAPENLCLTCVPCNRSKGAKLPNEWNERLL